MLDGEGEDGEDGGENLDDVGDNNVDYRRQEDMQEAIIGEEEFKLRCT
jgi:hypothetical protein